MKNRLIGIAFLLLIIITPFTAWGRRTVNSNAATGNCRVTAVTSLNQYFMRRERECFRTAALAEAAGFTSLDETSTGGSSQRRQRRNSAKCNVIGIPATGNFFVHREFRCFSTRAAAEAGGFTPSTAAMATASATAQAAGTSDAATSVGLPRSGKAPGSTNNGNGTGQVGTIQTPVATGATTPGNILPGANLSAGFNPAEAITPTPTPGGGTGTPTPAVGTATPTPFSSPTANFTLTAIATQTVIGGSAGLAPGAVIVTATPSPGPFGIAR